MRRTVRWVLSMTRLPVFPNRRSSLDAARSWVVKRKNAVVPGHPGAPPAPRRRCRRGRVGPSGAGEADGLESPQVAGEVLGDLRYTVANEILQQRAGQATDPVGGIGQHRLAIGGIVVRVALNRFDVDGWAAQEAVADELAQTHGLRTELEVVPDRDAAACGGRQLDQIIRPCRGHGEGFLDTHVAAGLQHKWPNEKCDWAGVVT